MTSGRSMTLQSNIAISSQDKSKQSQLFLRLMISYPFQSNEIINMNKMQTTVNFQHDRQYNDMKSFESMWF